MPAIGTRATDERTRRLRRVGLGLAVLFIATLAPATADPVAGKDWTPQIQVTRRAQIYWESIMRSADADLRGLKKSQRQARKKQKRIVRNLERATERRAAARGRLSDARSALSVARGAAKAELAQVEAAIESATLALSDASSDASSRDVGLLDPFASLAVPRLLAGIDRALAQAPPGPDTTRLERKVKQQKRTFKQAKRKAKRAVRNVRVARNRVASLKAAERSAIGRRESAEGNLGAWILGMTKYGRIRASKKSKARPGINSSFAWPVHGRLSQGYHAGHDGLDIVRYSGAPIRAAAFGVVTYVGWNPWDKEGRAFVVVITHAGRYETAYGHLLPRRSVRVGQEVRKGEVIGYMGNTGKSTGTHLHFELRSGRSTLNPLAFL